MFRFLSIFVAAVFLVSMASADTLELCPGGAYVGSPSMGVTIATAPGGPQCKTKSYVTSSIPTPNNQVHGLGVSGATGGEIDNGESVTLTFGPGGVVVQEFDIIVFYNGPEFQDTQEKGFVEAWFADDPGNPVTFWFEAEAEEAGNGVNDDSGTNGISDNLFGIAVNISPMTDNNAGWFQFSGLPFGTLGPQARKVTQLRFTAADQPSAGGNNSDYALRSVTFTVENVEVPEPGTYALMGLGLLGLAALRRRRKA